MAQTDAATDLSMLEGAVEDRGMYEHGLVSAWTRVAVAMPTDAVETAGSAIFQLGRTADPDGLLPGRDALRASWGVHRAGSPQRGLTPVLVAPDERTVSACQGLGYPSSA
jgi:hypothetical protein